MIDSILGIVNKFIPDKNKKYDALIALAQSDSESSKSDAAVLVKEMDTQVYKWRPRVAYLMVLYFMTFSFIYFILPPLIEIFDWNICTLGTCNLKPTSDAMFSFMIASVILLALIIGREIVKLIRAWKGSVL